MRSATVKTVISMFLTFLCEIQFTRLQLLYSYFTRKYYFQSKIDGHPSIVTHTSPPIQWKPWILPRGSSDPDVMLTSYRHLVKNEWSNTSTRFMCLHGADRDQIFYASTDMLRV